LQRLPPALRQQARRQTKHELGRQHPIAGLAVENGGLFVVAEFDQRIGGLPHLRSRSIGAALVDELDQEFVKQRMRLIGRFAADARWTKQLFSCSSRSSVRHARCR
jgi:hypothetical protein